MASSSVEGAHASSYDEEEGEEEDVQAAAAPQPVEVGIAAAEAIWIWDYLIGSSLGRRALRVVLASNAENAADLFRLRLVARRFHSELPKYVASLNFSGLNIPFFSHELFVPFSNLSLVDLSGCRLATGMTPARRCSSSLVYPPAWSRAIRSFLGGLASLAGLGQLTSLNLSDCGQLTGAFC